MPKIITYTTEDEWKALRVDDITSTDAAALFGLSPYCTEFELYHRKKSRQIVEIDSNERMKWGKRLETSIAEGIAEDHGWTVRPLKIYARHSTQRGLGSSFDFEILGDPRGPGILEIKNVDYLQWKKGWINDGDDSEAPEHIEIQLQHQLEVIDYNWGAIAALVSGNSPVTLIRDRDRELGGLICKKTEQFWKDIENGYAPDPDFKKDASFIKELYLYVSGKELDLSNNNRAVNLCAEYKAATADEKAVKERKDAAKAELLTIIAEHPSARIGDYKISAGMVNKKEYLVKAMSYRDFRISGGK